MSGPTSGDSNSRSPLPSHVGRRITPSSISNAEENEVNDFEYFGLRPRGQPNLEAFLEIWSVDVHPNPDDINRRQHHTALYDCSNLIVRRGQPFQVTITVNRAIDLEKDRLWIEFLIGRYPDRTKGTYIPILIKEQLEKGQWGAKVVSIWNNALTLSVMSSPQCIVGRFRMYVAVMTPYGIRRTVRDKDTDIYILFNPWCEEDAVYLDNDAEKEEYVLNDIGCIYYGKFTEVVSRTWFFDQFERKILDTCIYILDRAQMPLQTRGCPVKISRVVSAMINSKDDGGVLVGCWDGEYTNGISPTAWNSSREILQQYAETGLPVCYGQCWVFAAVLNTVLRCLGIPGRVITNFSSAHDNDANLTTDIILDENGKKDTNLTKDSIWNYHCWNECWMARIDLPPEYSGWQVIDATPQETSEGMFRCGPASVNAIKHGQVYLPYDVPFIYAEVNSDIVYWTKQKDGSLIKGDVKTDEIGKLVLTKEIGSDSRKDITNQYKYEEGSPEERMALNTAIQYGLKKEQAVTEVTMDVSLNMHVPENVLLGTNFFVGIELQNNSNEKRSTTVFLSGTVVFYTGVPKIEFMRETIKVTVEPHQVHQAQVKIKSKDYVDHLVEQSILHFFISGRVNETGQTLAVQKTVTLQIPKLNMRVEGPVMLGHEVTLVIEFTNPLRKPLEHLILRIDGLDTQKAKLKMFSILQDNATLTTKEVFVPKKRGQRKVIASLDSGVLKQVIGELELNVT
ncbi:coagulation factor XIII A chain-like [Hemiscyllium ocellatum]|uniref:coagulation factor XIII A chain-like n=1 Tax=Hemiscyllium ocellatum TaxID=170820 RepID=UPI002966E7F4|nr:coagulation factor XIII A chain-like [Hemiscyllium ocellatum]XP_060706294.1 coagulation factor XIII A chain-like [Hemiscyllium ocellatum]